MTSYLLKTIILDNERFVLNQVGRIVPREGLRFPTGLRKVCVLYGVRRSGKSFVLYDLFKKYPDRSLYIDFEDERLEGFAAQDFERLKDCFYELNPELIKEKGVHFFLDEVQNTDGWEKFARRLVEHEGIQVFATGSSSAIMPEELHSTLRGRSWGVSLLPFSFREYAASKNILLNENNYIYGRQKSLTKNCFGDYLKWGGFPEISPLKTEVEIRKVLKEYMDAMFF